MLELGMQVIIVGVRFEVIGVMWCIDDDEQWIEYFLYNEWCGFFWLVEVDDGWSIVLVFQIWLDMLGVDGVMQGCVCLFM